MIFINSAAALEKPLDPDIRRLLVLRFQQMGGADDAAHFHLVEPSDDIAAVEVALGMPLLLVDGTDEAPFWEWAERHCGDVLEVCFNNVEDGPANVLIVPQREEYDAVLIALLTLHAAEDLERQQAVVR